MPPSPEAEVEKLLLQRRMDKVVSQLDDENVRRLFDDLNEEAEEHPPRTRELYLALYRRLHG